MNIKLESVSKKYGAVRALNATSLDIESGQIIAVLGPNGAGKTTFLRCLATLSAPSGGRILVGGQRLTRDRLDLRRRMMFLPDFPPLYGHFTVLNQLSLGLRIYERETQGRETDTVTVLRDLDLLTLCDTQIGRLSRGQMYKTALAMLVLVNPDVWLIDEPFASGIDPNGITYFKDHARERARTGGLVIYSTQILDIAEALSDRVCVIHKGDVRAFDSIASLSATADRRAGNGVLEDVFRKLREEDR